MENARIHQASTSPGRKLKGNILARIFAAVIVLGFFLHLSTYQSYLLAVIQKFKQPQKWQWANNFIIPNASILDANSSTLLNLNFAWIKSNKLICKSPQSDLNEKKLLAILVHTSRSHFSERSVIRKTWGSIKLYKNWTPRLIFLMGAAKFDAKQSPMKFKHEGQKLLEEQTEFHDLVIGNFTDTYKNLTYKHLMGYKWVLNYCQNANLVIKTDDDVFIDIMRFIDWRSQDLSEDKDRNTFSGKPEKVPDLYCYNYDGTIPVRNKSHKWYVSEEQWSYEFYPDYCSGWGYAITVDLIQKLYSVSTHVKYFWVDDVFATGALVEVVKNAYAYHPVKRNISGEITRNIEDYREAGEKKLGDKRRFGAVVHVLRGGRFERDMVFMWNKTVYDFKKTENQYERILKL